MAPCLRFAVLAGALLLSAAQTMETFPEHTKLTNHNGAFLSYPDTIFLPTTVEDFRTVVMEAKEMGKRVRVVGQGHGWSGLGQSDAGQYVIDTRRFNRIVEISTERKEVTVQSGVRVHDLNTALHKHGLALQGMGAVALQSVGGVVATSTHGSNKNTSTTFSDQVASLTLMDANGDVHFIDRSHPHFRAAKTNLGMLGAVLEITLQATDPFWLKVEQTLIPMRQWTLASIRKDFASVNHSVTYGGFPHLAEPKMLVQKTNIVAEPEYAIPLETSYAGDQYGFEAQEAAYRQCVREPWIAPYLMEALVTASLAYPQPAKPSFDLLAQQTTTWYDPTTLWLDSEYVVPLEKLPEVWEAILNITSPVKDIGIYYGIRFQAASDSLIATTSDGTGSTGMFAMIDVIYQNKVDDHYARVQIEAALLTHGARAHWGKKNELQYTDVVSLYGQANVNKFKEAKAAFDANNMFGNAYTDAAFMNVPPQTPAAPPQKADDLAPQEGTS